MPKIDLRDLDDDDMILRAPKKKGPIKKFKGMDERSDPKDLVRDPRNEYDYEN